MDGDALAVAALALGTALATGLGALPLAVVRRPSTAWVGVGDAAAAGFMAAASVALALEGGGRSWPRMLAGAALGVVFIAATRRALHDHEHLHLGVLRGADARRALVVVTVMTVHSSAEGIGVGVSFGGGEALGLVITAAIALHNVPEGLAVALVLVPRGTRVTSAAGWAIATSLPQPVLAVPAYLLVEHVEPALPVGLGFAAGAMVWLAASELVPAAHERTGWRTVVLVAGGAFAAMAAFQTLVLGL